MKMNLKLDRLLPALPVETREALQSTEGFSADAEVKRRTASAPVLEEGERAVVRYLSTRDVDRDREVLVPGGAVTTEWEKAPQWLWGHDYSIPPIGRASEISVDDRGVKAKVTYAETPRAEEVWQLIKGGFLTTASVGFIALERRYKGEPEWASLVKKLNKAWGVDLEGAGAEVITTKWVVIEASDVPVPANPNALVTAIAKGLSLSDDIIEQLHIEPEARRVVKRVLQAEPRVARLVKAARTPSDDRRVIAIATEVLDRLRGRV